MRTFVAYMLIVAASLTLVPVSVLFFEVLLAVTRAARPIQLAERRRLAILIPAHNESSLLAATLRSIAPQLLSGDRILVVADNCTDDTAMIAHNEGAEVIIRTNLNDRGKGFALDFGVRHLEKDPPDIVLVIDADCQVAPGTIDRLARACDHYRRPTQALYLMRSPANSSITTKISEFAWLVKNQVRPSGLSSIGLPCHLTGSGMAFPWMQIRSCDLATGQIVEDLKLGIDMARAGNAPMYCADAVITSEFPISDDGVRQQRTRWEHGHINIILSEAPRLIIESLTRSDINLLALSLDVTVPPLALLTIAVILVWLARCAFFFVAGGLGPFVISSTSAAMVTVTIYLSWVKFGRHILSIRELAFGLVYAILKIPLYKQFLVARQTSWTRSKRDKEN